MEGDCEDKSGIAVSFAGDLGVDLSMTILVDVSCLDVVDNDTVVVDNDTVVFATIVVFSVGVIIDIS